MKTGIRKLFFAVIFSSLLFLLLREKWQIEPLASRIALASGVLLAVFFLIKWNTFAYIPGVLQANRALVWQLSKNDFKTRFAGSYLGVVWAFVQPTITVLMYWFVFQVGFRSGDQLDVPFILWFLAGIIPWFFFSDAFGSGTGALIEYNYLVKKVVFQIDILPVVKIVSALFVHAFFLLFMLLVYACYGYYPTLYTLQVFYYTLCMIVLLIGLCYITASAVVFFRDLSQAIGVVLSVGTWLTPIMWNFDAVSLSPFLKILFQMNPMFYVVNGYRDALISHIWFWERPGLTLYFWCLTALLWWGGTAVFRRLKFHFADVL